MTDKFGNTNNDNIHNDAQYDKARELGQVIENKHVAEGNPEFTATPDLSQPQNPNHDVDPYMNQSNANLTERSPVPASHSYDEEQKVKDAAGPGPLPAVPTDTPSK